MDNKKIEKDKTEYAKNGEKISEIQKLYRSDFVKVVRNNGAFVIVELRNPERLLRVLVR